MQLKSLCSRVNCKAKTHKTKTGKYAYPSSRINLFTHYTYLTFINTVNIYSTQKNPELKINTETNSLLPSKNSLSESSEEEYKDEQLQNYMIDVCFIYTSILYL